MLVLSPDANIVEEISGLSSTEMVPFVKEEYPGAVRILPYFMAKEIAKRNLHTPEVAKLLELSPHGDLRECYLYGSRARPLDTMDATIEGAKFLQVDKDATGCYSYVAVPELLERAIIERYQLMFVSGPVKTGE